MSGSLSPEPLVVEQPQSTRGKQPTLLCNQVDFTPFRAGHLNARAEGVYHFSPPCNLTHSLFDGVLRTEGKLLHLMRIGCGALPY